MKSYTPRGILEGRVSFFIDTFAIRNLTWLAVEANYRQVVLFAINVYMASILGERYFGLISFGYALMLVFNGLGDFGIRSVAWRELSRIKDKSMDFRKQTGLYLTLRTFTSAMAFLIFIFFILVLNRPLEDKMILLFFGIPIFFSQIAFDWPFRAVDRMHIPAFASILFSTFFLFSVFFFLDDSSEAFRFSLFLGVANFVAFAYLVYVFILNFGRPILAVNFKKFKSILKESYPLGINTFVIRLNASFPLILLGLFWGDYMLAQFRTAHLIFAVVASFSLHFAGSIFSRISLAFVQGDFGKIRIAMKRTSFLSMATFIPICAAIFLFSDEIMTLFFGGGIVVKSSGLLKIMMVIAPIMLLNNLYKELLIAINRQHAILKLNLFYLTATILVLPPLAYNKGLTGLTIGILIAEALGFAVTCFYYRWFVRLQKII